MLMRAACRRLLMAPEADLPLTGLKAEIACSAAAYWRSQRCPRPSCPEPANCHWLAPAGSPAGPLDGACSWVASLHAAPGAASRCWSRCRRWSVQQALLRLLAGVAGKHRHWKYRCLQGLRLHLPHGHPATAWHPAELPPSLQDPATDRNKHNITSVSPDGHRAVKPAVLL